MDRDPPEATVEVGDNIVHITDEATRRAAVHLLVGGGVITADEVQAAEDRLTATERATDA